MKDKKLYRYIFPIITIIILVVGILIMDKKNNKLENNTIPQPIDTTISGEIKDIELVNKNDSTNTEQRYDSTNNDTRLE